MTTASLLSKIGDGHGLVTGITERDYDAMQKDKPIEQLVALVVLEPASTSQRRTAKGKRKNVAYEAVRLEVVSAEEASRYRMLVEEMYAVRTSKGQVMRLPLGYADEHEERRLELIEKIKDFADAEALTPQQLNDKWASVMGETDSAPADWTAAQKHASGQHILMFGQYLGAFEEEPEPKPEDSFPDEREAAGKAADAPPAPEAAFSGS